MICLLLTPLHVFLFSLSVSIDACLIRWGNSRLFMLDCCEWPMLPCRCFAPLCPLSPSSSSSALDMLLLTSESRSEPVSSGQSVVYSISSTHGGSSSSKQLHERGEEEHYVTLSVAHQNTLCVVYPWGLTNIVNAFPSSENICRNNVLNIYLFHVYVS